MPDGDEFILGPIPLGYYRYTDLLEGPLSIEHVAEINDAMAYETENRHRIHEALKTK
ncbi:MULTISPECIES: hypothetical protein [Methylobacterium]|uniref:Uncharacterized protein n=2 Tax=Pseudomonadota TaxID=1224 RepID=A0ABQ4T1E7_9HYPH|nr:MULTISPECIES: hypothetical protein [Methylobacterium]GBU18023.1 hypothetical protein AwMethylo_22380 [Methylobacterium sp.]GJE08629.1 hypothetical protein AOPFMNJM_3972 [Methylobacterium jeotgali]